MLLLRLEHVGWDVGQVLRFQEEGRGEALYTDVQDAMLGRFELEVGDAGEDINEVDDELVVDGLD